MVCDVLSWPQDGTRSYTRSRKCTRTRTSSSSQLTTSEDAACPQIFHTETTIIHFFSFLILVTLESNYFTGWKKCNDSQQKTPVKSTRQPRRCVASEKISWVINMLPLQNVPEIKSFPLASSRCSLISRSALSRDAFAWMRPEKTPKRGRETSGQLMGANSESESLWVSGSNTAAAAANRQASALPTPTWKNSRAARNASGVDVIDEGIPSHSQIIRLAAIATTG